MKLSEYEENELLVRAREHYKSQSKKSYLNIILEEVAHSFVEKCVEDLIEKLHTELREEVVG